jgi:2-methylcitrate dehydratase PrpD
MFVASSNDNITGQLVKTVRCAGGSSPDALNVAAVRRMILDYLAVTIAGGGEPVAKIVCEEFASADGICRIIGSNLRSSPANAALVNGTTGHALDYDDVHASIGHPGTVILPAAFAAAEDREADGSDLVRAVNAGVDAARFVGSLVMPGHYEAGYHSTSTIGVFGAAAAAGTIMNLTSSAMTTAIGLAATQAAGLKCMFGTMAKPFHAGRAAWSGVVAARLAAGGFTANNHALESEQGFLSVLGVQSIPACWSSPPIGQAVHEVKFKAHAACFLTHSTIEALHELCRCHGATDANIEHVLIEVPPGHLRVCNLLEPATGLESKFSLRHVAALVLTRYDTAALETYSDGNARDTRLVAVRQKATVRGNHQSSFGARVTVRLANGQVHSLESDVTKAIATEAELDNRLRGKFRSLVIPMVGIARADELERLIDIFQTIPVKQLLDAAR